MVIKKVTNQEVKSISDAKEVMSQNEKNIIQESKYQSDLRRNKTPITRPKTQTNTNKEPHVIVKGFDVATGKMRAEDKSTGKIFNSIVLSDGPLAIGSRVMGFPPGHGQTEGAIRGPMKGPPIPPLETPKKKPKKKAEEVTEVLELRYTLTVAFISP